MCGIAGAIGTNDEITVQRRELYDQDEDPSLLVFCFLCHVWGTYIAGNTASCVHDEGARATALVRQILFVLQLILEALARVNR